MLEDVVVRAMGTDGDGTPVAINTTLNTYSKIGKYCSNDNTVWGIISNYNATLYSVYGDLVHDASICDISAAGKGKVVTSNNATGLVSWLYNTIPGQFQCRHKSASPSQCSGTAMPSYLASCLPLCRSMVVLPRTLALPGPTGSPTAGHSSS